MIFTIISFAALTGSPLAGKFMQMTGGDYLAAQMWGGSSMILGAVLLFAAKKAEERQKS